MADRGSLDLPWPAGTATGIGSLPGTDPVEAARIVAGEFGELPHQPELPVRGPGADLVGRTAATLADLYVDLQPSGWRLVSRPGVDWRRAREIRERDLDALGEVFGEYRGPLKLQLGGIWTLAASVELPRGAKALADPGAVRDLTQSLAEGAADHLAQVRQRVPAATVLLQWDEPSLPAVLAGRVATASGFGALRAVPEPDAEQALAQLIAAVPHGWPVVHCCADDAPVALLRGAGAAAISLDADRLPDEDTLGEAIDAGLALWLGVAPATGGEAEALRPQRLADRARTLWRRWGFPPERLPRQVVLTPACGLAGATTAQARQVMRAVRQAGRILADDPG